MGADSKIEWTHHTFNPWWGCVKVSPGCAHCYADTFAKRVGQRVWGPDAPRRFFGDKHWREPLKWNRDAATAGVRRRVFCASMADVFEDRSDLVEPRERLFRLIEQTPHLDWLLLTKRPENIRPMLSFQQAGPIDNIWLGTTVEDQERADERIPHLLAAPAAVHFLSVEPLLGPVNLLRRFRVSEDTTVEPLTGVYEVTHEPCPNLTHGGGMQVVPGGPRIDWVIVGGESGPGARPMHPSWAVSVVEQCREAGTPCFFKQAGSVLARQMGFRDAKGGDMNEWPSAWHVREFPREEVRRG